MEIEELLDSFNLLDLEDEAIEEREKFKTMSAPTTNVQTLAHFDAKTTISTMKWKKKKNAFFLPNVPGSGSGGASRGSGSRMMGSRSSTR